MRARLRAPRRAARRGGTARRHGARRGAALTGRRRGGAAHLELVDLGLDIEGGDRVVHRHECDQLQVGWREQRRAQRRRRAAAPRLALALAHAVRFHRRPRAGGGGGGCCCCLIGLLVRRGPLGDRR